MLLTCGIIRPCTLFAKQKGKIISIDWMRPHCPVINTAKVLSISEVSFYNDIIKQLLSFLRLSVRIQWNTGPFEMTKRIPWHLGERVGITLIRRRRTLLKLCPLTFIVTADYILYCGICSPKRNFSLPCFNFLTTKDCSFYSNYE